MTCRCYFSKRCKNIASCMDLSCRKQLSQGEELLSDPSGSKRHQLQSSPTYRSHGNDCKLKDYNNVMEEELMIGNKFEDDCSPHKPGPLELPTLATVGCTLLHKPGPLHPQITAEIPLHKPGPLHPQITAASPMQKPGPLHPQITAASPMQKPGQLHPQITAASPMQKPGQLHPQITALTPPPPYQQSFQHSIDNKIN